MGRGMSHAPQSDDVEVVNATKEDEDADIRAIMSDPDLSSALMRVIDDMASESLSMTMTMRADHASMLGHLGAYARLQDVKAELRRLAGLTDS